MIKFTQSPDHSRFLNVSYKDQQGIRRTLRLNIDYLDARNAGNGADMDSIVMPAIKKRLKVK
jgi:hypothetical protein